MRKGKTTLISLLIFILTLTSNVFAAGDSNTEPPTIYGKTAMTIDVETGEIIYAKNIDKRMYPASTTKYLTALLLAENKGKNDNIPYTATAKSQPQYSLNINLHPINIGETIKAENVMDGLLLFSGNDVAYMIGDALAGNNKNFENMMSKKIQELNLKNTHFVTPNGLHNPNHYTTAYDLSVISRAALKNPWVYQSSNKKESSIVTSKGTKMAIENSNKLLGKDGCVAGKTGYTDAAGRCLVTLFNRDGRKILGVVMGSVYDAKDSFVFQDMKKIIDWSYNVKPSTLYKKDSSLKTETVTYNPLKIIGPSVTIDVPIILKEDVTYYKNEVNDKEANKTINIDNTSYAALSGKKNMGTLTVKEREYEKKYEVYSGLPKEEIMKKNMPFYVVSIILVLAIITVIFFLVKFFKNKINKKNRNKNKYWY
ncbi:D-alanyl-D-alanine carboxypeptidase family protein [Clostridium botulinum]|uniref:D-alanyl-D-alanine carboxypeptidase n=1 Tax=Clostridium botulinum (strain Hall / ATCC 3502 / NCTC 13319 / Type A) TaxID=441771 RepID=A5I1N6_CLOBH|nr:D-alanyl-D-alanine carboxypeptidase family protein [Clostridium botulinum]ABS35591.1 D-alanyl-D-alanine carboxypeptidase family protein [Clostridium botulinum A str. ATCC 19397]ABS37970.1 D-alanyl-D-alanine carboxypeptidase family protein [Clostridium botulinum A str. Hall]AWB17367.1 D-alanyl-D-alanine carboxypeptidase [Clostridium botulinum]AWB30157.1 D-alanyl-D-alanine carboxypeptidase [Clostridium botulinum]EGT5616529.1 D-alanyl-D-alanine carboxypeptidase [Clostridium botulinum]